MKRAQESGALDLHIHNLRAWTSDKHHVVDDAPFGGGQGMVMKPEPIFAAVEDLQNQRSNIKHQTSKVILMSPTGRRFDQRRAAGGTAIHAPGGVSWLESSGNPAEWKPRRNREVARRTGAKTHARKSTDLLRD